MSAPTGSTHTPSLSAKVRSVKEILEDPDLTIPEYQRPYSWQPQQARQLVWDILRFQELGEYRIGTFIVHPNSTSENSKDSRLDIVDGQQRYLTFALIALALDGTSDRSQRGSIAQRITIPARFDGVSDDNLRANFEALRETVSPWREDERRKFAAFFLNQCNVVELQVAGLDGAFQMFDSQNTRGKPLFPIDLLKAHHLREMSRAGLPRERVLQKVRNWEAAPPSEINHVIGGILYPIKKWSANEPVPSRGFTDRDINMFKGLNHLQVQEPHPWAQQLLLAREFLAQFNTANSTLIRSNLLPQLEYPFQILQPIIDGEMFFELVSHYLAMARQAGVGTSDKDDTRNVSPEVRDLVVKLAEVPLGTGNRYLRELFDCLLIAHADRFGWAETGKVARRLVQHAFRLRALYRVQHASVDNYARGSHRVKAPNLFTLIASSYDPALTGAETVSFTGLETDEKNRVSALGPLASEYLLPSEGAES